VVKKIKKLKLRPSARDKRRYFLVKASNKKVEEVLLKYVGIFGFARAAYKKVNTKDDGRWKIDSGYIVGSCLVGSLDEVRAALGMEEIEIVKVSGTLKGLRGSRG
jgi:hypothetical protein